MSHACHPFWTCYKTLMFLLTFGKVQNTLRLPCKTTSERPKVVQLCSVFTFWLGATTAGTFSSSQLPKVLRSWCSGVQLFHHPKVVWEWCVLHILTSKCAARHNGVHFFIISTSKSDLRIVCFVHYDLEMCFAPQRPALFHLISPDGSAPATLASLLVDRPEPQIIAKTQCAATLLPFRAAASSVFWLFLFSDLLSYSLLFSDSSHLCFFICPYCRKFDF